MNITTDNSSSSLITKIWGPSMWIALHSISFCYPINPTYEEKQNYKKFFELLGELLPCLYCKESYKQIIKKGSLIL